MPHILHRIVIHASPERVYQALSEQRGLAGWWTTNTTASPEVGAINHFRFDDRGFNDMKVLESIPSRLVRWECVDGAKEWIGTEITFDLVLRDGVTVVLFAQRNWREEVEFMHYCSTKWGVYMLSLKALCQTGEGRPYPHDIDIE